MDGSELVFILMPIVIPIFLALGIAAPYIADSRANKRLARFTLFKREIREDTRTDRAKLRPGKWHAWRRDDDTKLRGGHCGRAGRHAHAGPPAAALGAGPA